MVMKLRIVKKDKLFNSCLQTLLKKTGTHRSLAVAAQ